jgi:hypothetical protein
MMKFSSLHLLALSMSAVWMALAPGCANAFAAATQLSLMPGERANWGLTQIADQRNGIIRCEGKSRKTFVFNDITKEDIQGALCSEGRPLNAEIQLWIGPNWTPYTLKAYSDDGKQYPVQFLVGTRNKQAELEIRNVGQMEFPLNAACAYAKPPLAEMRNKIPREMADSKITVQGGAIKSFPLDPSVEQTRVLLNTDTRQLNAVVELLNGPNNVKQRFEIFTNNGVLNSLYVVFNTPGSGNTVRIMNQATIEFPAYAYISTSED